MTNINTTHLRTEHADYIRDVNSKALLSTNTTKLMAYKEKKRIAEQNMQTLERCVGDINNLKDDIAEIKALLSRIISKIN